MRIRITYEDVARLTPAQKQALMKLAQAIEDSVNLSEMTADEACQVTAGLDHLVHLAAEEVNP